MTRYVFVDEYYPDKQAMHGFDKSFFPNECKMILSAPHNLKYLITHENVT